MRYSQSNIAIADPAALIPAGNGSAQKKPFGRTMKSSPSNSPHLPPVAENDAPFFSVVVPTFNRSHCLGKTIESVLASTFQDFELLVVDDGSTDNTEALVASFGDSRVRYFFIENSGGPARPRNIGIAHSRGAWLCFLDSDDLFLPRKLEILHSKILEAGRPVVLYSHLRSTRNRILGRRHEFSSNHTLFWFLLWTPIALSGACVSRELIETLGVRFDEDKRLSAVEDCDFWISLHLRKACFVFIEAALGIYNEDTEDSISKTPVHYKKLKLLLERYEHHLGTSARFVASSAIECFLLWSTLRNKFLRTALASRISMPLKYSCFAISALVHPVGAVALLVIALMRTVASKKAAVVFAQGDARL